MIKKDKHFSVPTNYFDNFKDEFMKQISAEDKSSSKKSIETQTLDKTKAGNSKTIKEKNPTGFNTPFDFHENAKLHIINKIKNNNKSVLTLFSKKVRYSMYIAASILICFIMFTSNNQDRLQTTVSTNNIDSTNILKQKTKEQFNITEKDANLLALFVDDKKVDTFLEELLIEDIAFEN